MKTSVFNAKNLIREFEFDYSIRLRNYVRRTDPSYWDNYLKYVFRINPEIRMLIYASERDKSEMNYHSHLLVQSNYADPGIFFTGITGNYIKKIGTNKKILKTPVKLFNPITNEKMEKMQDKYYIIPYEEYKGDKGSVLIEKIIQNENAVYYAMKMTDRGLNYNNLIREITCNN